MGAICGIFNLNENDDLSDLGLSMMDKISKYHIDNLDDWHNKEAFLGCALQYVTPESKIEKLPFFDKESKLVITADAIIDNRNELFTLMNIPECEWGSISDSQLILKTFKNWGEECLKYLVGDFAFAIWNVERKELFCARDHVGNRTLYFYHSENVFAICTLAKPLLCFSEEEKKLNDRWIANYLSLDGPIHEVDCNETIYKNIYQLLPAHYIKFSKNNILKNKYWDPLKLPPINYKTDEEYEQKFREIFFEAVDCRLRSIGSVGVMMSGGLDSGSVACVAAQKLEANGKRLKCYSAIPFSGYKDWLPKVLIANEREYIESINEHVENIDITYCNSEGKSAVTNVDEYIDFLEQPYKFVRNFFWINEIVSIAKKDGCTVMLDGQFGNFTISFGNLPTHLITLFRKGKWLSIPREIRDFSRLRNYKYWNVTKEFIKMILPENIKNDYNKLMARDKPQEDNSLFIPVNPELAARWKVDECFKKKNIGSYKKIYKDLDETREIIASPVLFSQTGSVYTKMSLKYGVLKRDPTRDKRVIEFCLRIPGGQFVKKGSERDLIRRTMKGILPDKIRLNYDVMGRQSADFIQRLLPMWQEIQEEVREMLENEKLKPYLDVDKISKVLNDLGDSPKDDASLHMNMIIVSLIFGRFITSFESEVS